MALGRNPAGRAISSSVMPSEGYSTWFKEELYKAKRRRSQAVHQLKVKKKVRKRNKVAKASRKKNR